jgi:hypothetical protein
MPAHKHSYLPHSHKSANKLAVPCYGIRALNRPSPLFTSAQALAPAPCILACSVQALAPAPGELTCTTPPHRSSLARGMQAAGHQDQGESCCGFGRLRHRCALRAILPLRQRLLTSARSARVLTQGDCRTERPTALRREPSRSTSPGELPARSLRELASS